MAVKHALYRMSFKLLLVTTLSGVLFFSCTARRYLYSPPAPKNPLFTKKGDAQVSVYGSGQLTIPGTGNFSRGYDLQAAYSPLQHFSLAAGFSARWEKNSVDRLFPFNVSVVRYRRQLTELAGGYYTFINKSKDITVNLYAGAGKGSLRITDRGKDLDNNDYTRFLSTSLTNYFVQPGFNFFSKDIRIGLLLRITRAHFSDVHTDYNKSETNYFGLTALSQRSLYLYEPAVNAEADLSGGRGICRLSFSLSAIINGNTQATVRFSNISLGISVDPLKIFK
jgi:hypothetical protein